MINAARRTAIFIGIVHLFAAMMVLALPVFIPYKSFDSGTFWLVTIAGIWCAISGLCGIVGGALLMRQPRAARTLLIISAILGLNYYMIRICKQTKPLVQDNEKEEAS